MNSMRDCVRMQLWNRVDVRVGDMLLHPDWALAYTNIEERLGVLDLAWSPVWDCVIRHIKKQRSKENISE